MGMFDMEKYRYKNVEPVCILNFASKALKSSNSVGVDCNGCSWSDRAVGPRWPCTADSQDMWSVLVKVRGPVLVFEGKRFKALGHGFVLLLLLLLLLLLGEGETRGDSGGGGAVGGSGPHRRLQHLHGVAPLGGRGDVHLVQGRAGIGHGVVVGGVLPWRFGRPGFSLAVLLDTVNGNQQSRKGQLVKKSQQGLINQS